MATTSTDTDTPVEHIATVTKVSKHTAIVSCSACGWNGGSGPAAPSLTTEGAERAVRIHTTR
jgi:hypothetical protein